MPIGERVGEAYVAILADGDGLDRSIRDELDNVDFDKHGRKASKEWTDNWAKEMQSAPNQKKLRDGIAGPLIKGDWLSQSFFRSNNWKNFKAGLEKEYGAAGKRAGETLEKDLLNGMDFSRLNARLADLTPDLVRAQKGLTKELEQESAARAKALAEEAKKSADWEKQWRSDTDKITASMIKSRKAIFTNLTAVQGSLDKTRTATLRFGEKYESEFRKPLSDTRHYGKFRRGLLGAEKGIDDFSGKIGKTFGKGSRNNFLNFFGGLVEGAFKVTKIFPLAARSTADFVSNLSQVYKLAGGGGSGVKAVFSSLAGSAGALSKNVVVAGVALALLVTLVGPIISIVSGLAAAVTALAGSLVYAAVGGIAPLVGLLAPLAAGIGVGILAFQGMDKAAKATLAASLKPLTAEFVALRKAAGDELAAKLPSAFTSLRGTISGLRPLVTGVASAIGDVAQSVTDAIDSPGFRRFRDEFTAFLPGAIRSLGDTIINLGSGIGGVFRALIPQTTIFLDGVDKATGRFAKFANSADGQTKLKRFFADAAASAKSVGGFLKDASVALGQLLFAGKGTGDSIFDTLASKARELTSYLKANPQAVADFFANGKQIADDFGNAIMGIVKVFDTLDTPANRQLGSLLLKGLVSSANSLAFTFAIADGSVRALIYTFGALASAGGKVLSVLGKVPGFKWAKDLGTQLDKAGAAARDFASQKPAFDLGKQSASVRQFSTDTSKAYALTVGWTEALKGIKNQKIVLAISALGIEPTFAAFQKLQKQFHLTPRQLKIAAKATGFALTGKQLDQLTGKAKTFGKQKPNPKVTVNPKQATAAFAAVTAKSRQLDRENSRPKITLNTKPASTAYASVTAKSRALGREHAHPRITVEGASAGAAAIRSVMGLLGGLHDKTVHLTTVRTNVGGLKPAASGAMANYAQARLIGEAGPEAVVPLNRPLGQVDPAVRWLSAIAQGKVPGMARGGVVGGSGKTVSVSDGAIRIYTSDGRTAAREALNGLLARV